MKSSTQIPKALYEDGIAEKTKSDMGISALM